MSHGDSNSGSVIRKIFEWSQSRPLWQRDALRRVFQKTQLSDSDINELYDLILLSGEEQLTRSSPLLEEHLPPENNSSDSVCLESISEVKGVNNLAENQKLEFAPAGITVVYGDNGAGKSGYTRILRSSCRARYKAPVLPNVFSKDDTSELTALLKFSSGQVTDNEFLWENSDTTHPELTNISVFDKDCASAHIKDKNDVAYRPFGLDIPDKLADVSKALETKLTNEKRSLDRSKNAIFQNAPWSNQTEVGRKIQNINKDSDINVFKLLSELSKEEEIRLNHLTQSLSKDVTKAAREQENFASNIGSLNRAIESLQSKLADSEIDELLRLDTEAKELKEAAELSASSTFTEGMLDGIGGNIWKELWSSARKYSDQYAYTDREFPASEPDDLCLLCQQPLGETGSQNIKKFDEFVKSDLQNRATAAKNNFDIANRSIPTSVKLGASWNTIKQLRVNHPDMAKQCMTAYASARTRLASIKRNLDGNSEEELFPLTDSIAANLNTLSESYQNKATELRAAEDATKRTQLETEKKELEDRKTLQAHINTLEDEISRLKKVSELDQKISETNTRSITLLGNSIADDVVTPHLRDSFLNEIIGFVGNRVRVEINRSGGSYGSPEYKVSFLSDPGRDVSTVLSEGEQTCVAIASFMAEQATANHQSALVFDDPVSSLDHKWRSVVAERLVKEAANRQVVVFTHDLVFLNDLDDYAQRNGVPFESKHLDRKPESVGFVNESLPWDGMKIKARIDALEKEARKLGRDRNDLTDEEYKNKARNFYSKLRSSWERALEEVGLSHTVMRHRDYINPKNLKNISALDAAFCEAWSENYSKCCDYVDAHDGSRQRNITLPEPNVLLDDVTLLSDWVNGLKEKHKSLK